MIKAIVFDFDGVIVESTQIKTKAFRELFSRYQEKVDRIAAFHIKNMGVSRYTKFKYIYENVLRKPYSEEIGLELGRQFSNIVLEGVRKAPLVNGTREFLDKTRHKYLFFIASATPQDELLDIVSCKGLTKYFDGIFGTPATKIEIIETILSEYSLGKRQVVFVGDAQSDRTVAANLEIPFITRLADGNILLQESQWTIRDLTELEGTIQKINAA